MVLCIECCIHVKNTYLAARVETTCATCGGRLDKELVGVEVEGFFLHRALLSFRGLDGEAQAGRYATIHNMPLAVFMRTIAPLGVETQRTKKVDAKERFFTTIIYEQSKADILYAFQRLIYEKDVGWGACKIHGSGDLSFFVLFYACSQPCL